MPANLFKKGEHFSPQTEFKKGETRREKRVYWNKDWLENEYITLQKSAEEITNEQGCKIKNIYYFLHKNNIPTRTMKEVRKIKHWGLMGESNGMYNKSGEKNPNWKGGITAERQIFYESKEWKDVLKIIWPRDKYRCQRCFMKYNGKIPFHIHHISSFKNKELRCNPNNLLLLCKKCHNWVHSKKNIEGIFLKNIEVILLDKFEFQRNHVYQGDVCDVLPLFPDNSVSCIVISSPY